MDYGITDTHTHPSFPLSDRVRRALWNMVWAILFRTSPRPFHGWRRFILRCFGAKVGRGAHIYSNARIWAPWNVEFGEECGVAERVILYSQGKIILGRRCVVSQGAHLCTGTHDYSKSEFPLVTAPISVGNEAWLAAECFVLPGVKIGDGAVIGARSVVTTNIPSWMVCAGHPCKPIKSRKKFGPLD